MGRLSDAGTTVLCSVERRGDDGVPRFLDACEAEGFERRMVYRSAKGAPSPIELYELTKGGQEGFRGVAVEGVDSSSELEGSDDGGGGGGGDESDGDGDGGDEDGGGGGWGDGTDGNNGVDGDGDDNGDGDKCRPPGESGSREGVTM